MKRIFSLFLILLITVSLSSCSVAEDEVMVIGKTKISPQEYNYTYYSQVQSFCTNYADYLSYFELDPDAPLKEQPCPISETEQSWAEYFMDQTEEILKQVFSFYNAAVAEGMELKEEYLLQIDAFVLSATEAAQQEGKTLDAYLSEYYGDGLTADLYRQYLSHRLLATQYCDEKLAAIVYSQEEFETYYQANREAIDKVDFRVYTLTEDYLPADFSGTTETEVQDGVKALAQAFAEGLTSEEIFKDRALSFAPEGVKKNYQSDAATLAKNITTEDLANTGMSSWLFDQARVPGDVGIHETSGGVYTVCYFLSRHRDERPLVSMRHILLSLEGEDGQKDEETVRQAIQDLYTQWEASGFSEQTFISLASKHTEDPGSQQTGGLYESFAYGTMVAEINDWLYGEGRRAGDSSIIETSYGYHLVWFLGYGEIAWKNACLPGLQDADYYELLESLEQENPVTFSENHRDSLGNDK